MNQDLLNEMLGYLDLGVSINQEHFQSGQRAVYFGKSNINNSKLVVKYCLYHEMRVARIQREIRILDSISSKYFPKVHNHLYVTAEMISQIIDNMDPKEQFEQVHRLKASNIKPFFISIEEFIPNINWSEALEGINKIKNLVRILIQCFEALTLLWNSKIIHRDLKPANILIKPDLSPVVIDLGIAKSLNEGTRDLTNPVYGSPCTPAYAAPEQLTPNSEINYKADQFSMGVIAFEALSGQFPYGSFGEIGYDGLISNFNNGRLENIQQLTPGITPELAAFINKLLSIEPYKRFRCSEAILESLENIRGNLT